MSNGCPEPSAVEFDELRPAFNAWHDLAVAVVQRDLTRFLGAYTADQWHLADDGYYRRGPVTEHVWAPAGISELEGLSSYATLREAVAGSSEFGPLMGALVGTPLGLSSVNLWGLAMAALPSPDDLASGADTSSFNARYQYLLEQLTAREAEYKVLYFLQGVSFEGDRLELEPDLALERLTPAEVSSALASGLLKNPFTSFGVYQLQASAAFALKKTWRLPRIFGGELTQAQRDEVKELSDPKELGPQLIQCLSLLSGDSVFVTGTLTKRIDTDFTMFANMTSFRALPVPVPGAAWLQLDGLKAARLQELWKRLRDESFSQNRALALAVRRLGFATQRDRLEDRLIDVLIAAEAFYLTDAAGDAKDRGELKYRLALRAAVWSDGTIDSWNRREVFAQMKCGYDLRSIAVHGGEPKPRDMKVNGELATLAEVVQATQDIVRGALHKAILQITPGRRLVIPWEDLVLPDGTAPQAAEQATSTA